MAYSGVSKSWTQLSDWPHACTQGRECTEIQLPQHRQRAMPGFSGLADGKTESPCHKSRSPKAHIEVEFGVQDVYLGSNLSKEEGSKTGQREMSASMLPGQSLSQLPGEFWDKYYPWESPCIRLKWLGHYLPTWLRHWMLTSQGKTCSQARQLCSWGGPWRTDDLLATFSAAGQQIQSCIFVSASPCVSAS